MKKIILLIVIIARLAADPNILSQIDQSQGWFRTGWACMDIWNQDNDSINDLKAWFTNYVAQAILDATNNSAANTIIPPTFVINAAKQAHSDNNPWPLINFFFQYVYSINQVINNWIQHNQKYLQNVSNACTYPITSTNFDCNLLLNLTLQDLYEPIINQIFSTYGSQSGTPSSFANMTSGFGSLGKNFVDGTITLKINKNKCGEPNHGWTMGTSINTNSISVPAWTLFTSLLTANYSQQVGTNGKSSINSMNTFGSTFSSLEYAPATWNPSYVLNLFDVYTNLASVQCSINNGTGCILSWSDNNSNNFATSGTWQSPQSSPCTATNSPVLSATISQQELVNGAWQYTGFCLPKQPNWTDQWYSGIINGCEIMTQL
jgi:hypothetical protein